VIVWTRVMDGVVRTSPDSGKAFAQINVKLLSVGLMSRTATMTGCRVDVFTTDMKDVNVYVRKHVVNFCFLFSRNQYPPP
jgi:hypothetical protein